MQTTFHIMAKPIGARCNLACSYCYYLHKENSYVTDPNDRKMSENVLRSFIRQYIDHQPGPAISFSWQGGEPTLLGVDYFEHIVELQNLYCPPDKAVANDIQTNGTLLDDRWCEFLRSNRFLVGVSVDGPPHIHDHYRLQHNGTGSSDKVVAGIRLMQKHQVEFNTLTVVNRLNAQHPLEVYNYLTGELGSNFLQFIPCVESVDFDHTAPGKIGHERMPRIGEPQARPGNPGSIVTDWSVDPDDYGNFLISIFDHWVRHDVGRIFVRTFDVMLGLWLGMGSSSCDFGEICGKALALEHDGSVYSCDHFVYPQYKLGNLTRTPL
ncbi:MAG: anaerobic sulfatase maturase, partial [Sedimentisphaerales bacterium]|nr:anaerobic sulfatase maturase [Sedimentisphaerales bacterium]